MRFLANEDVPGDVVAQLEAAGHDIVWVRTVAPGSKDEDVLALASFSDAPLQLDTNICIYVIKNRPEGLREGGARLAAPTFWQQPSGGAENPPCYGAA